MIKPFLYRPVDPYIVNQGFGQNMTCTDIKTGKKYISCDGTKPPAGYKSIYSKMNGHNGLDLNAKRWQKVYCAAKGKVTDVSTEVDRGLGVCVTTETEGKFFVHKYWHLIALDVEVGDEVDISTLLGYADSTGMSTGDHLHFEVKEVTSKGKIVNYNNGYFGAIDPAPLMIPVFALKYSLMLQLREKLAELLDKLSDKTRGK